MTQLAVAKNEKGIVVGIDSKAVYYPEGKGCEYINNIRKVLKITPEVVVAVAGSGHGIPLVESLKQHILSCGYWNYSDVVRRALVFLRAQLPVVQFRLREESRYPDLERFYFVFMGKNYTNSNNTPVPQAHVVLSEGLNAPIKWFEITSVITIPRQMGLEMSLLKAIGENQSKSYMQTVILNYLRKLSANMEDVGPPYQFVMVSPSGIEVQCIDE